MFRDLDGKTLILHEVPVIWTVKQLRDKLGSEKHLSDVVGDFRFIWNGKQLEDCKPLVPEAGRLVANQSNSGTFNDL